MMIEGGQELDYCILRGQEASLDLHCPRCMNRLAYSYCTIYNVATHTFTAMQAATIAFKKFGVRFRPACFRILQPKVADSPTFLVEYVTVEPSQAYQWA